MNYPIETDVIRRVQDTSGKCLEVAPYPEAPTIPCIRASTAEAAEYFGLSEEGIALDREFARQLGKALIACADELENTA